MEEILYKIAVLGDDDSKKTNFINKYKNDYFYDKYFRTLRLYEEDIIVTLYNGRTAKIHIEDINFNNTILRNIIKYYYSGVNGFIIVYNVNKINSFESAKCFLEDIRDYGNENNNNNIVLVGNQVKLNNDIYRVIPTEKGQKFAEENNLLFFETSHITGFNINECFNALINRIYKKDLNKSKYKFGINPLIKFLSL